MIQFNLFRIGTICTLKKSVLNFFRLAFFAGLTLLLCKPSLAQSTSKQLNDFTVQNDKLSDVMIQLSVQSGINFSIDANDSVMNNRLSYHAKNKTAIQILDDILPQFKRSYKQVGNQIVVFKPKHLLQKKETAPSSFKQNRNTNKIRNTGNNKRETPTPKAPSPPEIQLDTLIFTDTLLLHDTLIQYDTIRRIDTVFIRKEKNKPRKTKSFPVDYFQQKESRENGWSGEIFYAPLLTNFTFTDEKNPRSLRSFTLGTSVSRLSKWWDFSFGFQLSQFANRFNRTQTVTQGGFFLTDTIDAYYTVISNDTNWYFVTDSIWKPLQSYQSDYDRTNRIGYFEVNGSVAYTFFVNKKIRFYTKIGGQMSIPLYQNGMAILKPDNLEMKDFNTLHFGSPLFSALMGTGVKYRLNRSFDFHTEIFYVYYFQPMIQDLPVRSKPNSLGIKMGLIYYFR